MMNFAGSFIESSSNLKYYNFTTLEPVAKNGLYFINIYFPDTQQYMYVLNGQFVVNDSFYPAASELYLVKGINQNEFRMIPFNSTDGVSNAMNATHYDPRIDGSLRFHLYFRTNFNSELITKADFTNVQFKNAYLGYATL